MYWKCLSFIIFNVQISDKSDPIGKKNNLSSNCAKCNYANFLLLQSGVNRKPLRYEMEMFFSCLKKCEIFSLNIKKKYDFTNVSWFYDTAWAKTYKRCNPHHSVHSQELTVTQNVTIISKVLKFRAKRWTHDVIKHTFDHAFLFSQTLLRIAKE